MKRTARRRVLFDRLHKGFVLGCVAVTLYGMSHLGWRWYRYFTVLRPQAQQRELLEQNKLLAEGSSGILGDSAIDLKT